MTSIGNSAFQDCTRLTSLTIPDNVSSIGNNSFFGCSGLTAVAIPNSVTLIGEQAFKNCNRLSSLVIPGDLKMIKKQTFFGCKALKKITIPSSIEFVYQEAFAECYGLQEVIALPQNPPFLYDNSFSNYNITLMVPDSAKDAYMTTSPWSQFGKIQGLEEASGIEAISINNPNAHIYDMQGNRIDNLQKGVNIIRLEDGKTKKVIVK